MIYIPANENICGESIGVEVDVLARTRLHRIARAEHILLPNADHIGEVQAWDVDTGKKVWTHIYPIR